MEKLIRIYECLSDETRLRLLHLLCHGPLCVCHFQDILGVSQVAVSKHLAYLRKRSVVTARRSGKWMIYELPAKRPPELDAQLEFLNGASESNPLFRHDLKRLKSLKHKCGSAEILCAEDCGGAQ